MRAFVGIAIAAALVCAAVLAGSAAPLAPSQASRPARIKVIADQDSAGPHGTNFLSLLMLLKAPQVDLLGITTVSGDQWVDPATVFAVWATELTSRTDVPVVKGAEQPLLHSPREQELREATYGSLPTWHGSFNPDAPPPSRVWEPPGGMPKTQAKPGRAADFIIDTIRAHPNEVVLYAAGPLTNVALAVRMDPGIVPLTKALYVMGASSSGGFELNWWWDPEAAAIVMRQKWPAVVVTPGEIGFDVMNSAPLMKRIADSGGSLSAHVRSLYLTTTPPPGTTLWSAMWDELCVASLLDASVIARAETMYLDAVVDRGPKYGHTVVWKAPPDVPTFFLPYSGPEGQERAKWLDHIKPPSHLVPATVHVQADTKKFEDLFVSLLSR